MDSRQIERTYAEVAALVIHPGSSATGKQLHEAVSKFEKQANQLLKSHEHAHELLEHEPLPEQHLVEECRRLVREVHNLATEASRLNAKAKLTQSDRDLMGKIVDAIGNQLPKVIGE
jgi:endonuclease IV